MPRRLVDAIRSKALFAFPAAYTLRVPGAILGAIFATLLLVPLVFVGPVNSPASSEPIRIAASEVARIDEGLTEESQKLRDSRAKVVTEIDSWRRRLRALSETGPVEVSGLVDLERRQRIEEAEQQVLSAEETLSNLDSRLSSLDRRWSSVATDLGFRRCQHSAVGVFCAPFSIDPAIFAVVLLVGSTCLAMLFSGGLWSKIPDEREQYLPYARYGTWPFGAYLLALVSHLIPPLVLHALLNDRLGADYALSWLSTSYGLLALSAWIYVLWVSTAFDWGMRTRRDEVYKTSAFVTVVLLGLVGYSVAAPRRPIDFNQSLNWLSDVVPFSPSAIFLAVFALIVASLVATEFGRYLMTRGLFLLLATGLLLVIIAGVVTTWNYLRGYQLYMLFGSTTFSFLYVVTQRLTSDYQYPIRLATDENPFVERIELLLANSLRSVRGLFSWRFTA